MTRNKKFAFFLAAIFAICFVGIPAHAQAGAATASNTSSQKPKMGRFQVLHMMVTAIQVRSEADQHEIHTFVYSDRIRSQMQKLFNQGGYQYGDTVKIVYQPGSEIALNIKGKPSKPKTL